MVNRKKQNNQVVSWKSVFEIIGLFFAVFGGGFSAGWYIHGNVSSVEFHEKEMQLYNLHHEIDDRYENRIGKLEAEKRELEKELYELRKENLKQIEN